MAEGWSTRRKTAWPDRALVWHALPGISDAAEGTYGQGMAGGAEKQDFTVGYRGKVRVSLNPNCAQVERWNRARLHL